MIKPLAPEPSATPSAASKSSVAEPKGAEISNQIGRKLVAEPKGAEISNQIGRKLRAMFDDVVAEPVPEKFRRLLDELERKD